MMEVTSYEDSSRYDAIGSSRSRTINKTTHVDELIPRVGIKRPMTLDLDPSKRLSKKQKIPTTLLTSPDLKMLKLSSPELELLIIEQHGANSGNVITAVPTRSRCMHPPSSKNSEVDKNFAVGPNGFHHHLATSSSSSMGHHLHQQHTVVAPVNDEPCSVPCTYIENNCQSRHEHQNGITLSTSTTASCYNNSDDSSNISNRQLPDSNVYYHFRDFTPQAIIKEKTQTTAPLSSFDVTNQESIKLERKRLRNRIAADKCRKRKLEMIARLEDEKSKLKDENSELKRKNSELMNEKTELSTVVNRLWEQVRNLKQVIEHLRHGCEILNVKPDLSQL